MCWTLVSKCRSSGVCERVLDDSRVGSCRSLCVWDTTLRMKWNLPQVITSVCFFFYKICHAVVVFSLVVVVYLPMANISNKLTRWQFDIHGSVHRRWLSRNTNKMRLCNSIYYSKVYWRLNMFRAAHRSSSGALNCICSLWFMYPCGERS
jgi:hypothetical protein